MPSVLQAASSVQTPGPANWPQGSTFWPSVACGRALFCSIATAESHARRTARISSTLDRLCTARPPERRASIAIVVAGHLCERLRPKIKRRNPATWHVTQMRPHAALACALLRATAALESVPADAFRSVARGRVAVVDDFLARDVVAALRGDAEELWDAGLYSVATRVLAAHTPSPRPS